MPLQGAATARVQHGDYIRIATPPFEDPIVPTHFAVKGCQAGLSRNQIIQRFQQGDNSDSLFSEL